MIKGTRAKAGILLALSLLLSIVLPVAADEPPRLPSGFYGTAKQNGANVPNGTIVSAWINGVQYAETTTFLTTVNSVQVSVYTITVPGDDPSTSGVIEGGNEGDTIVFKIGIHPTDQTGTWHEGTDTELNLHATINYPPTTVSVSPSGYTCMPDALRTMQATYQDPNGWQDLANVYFMWNTSAVENIQQVRYEVATRKLYLRNDANTDWIGGFTPGTGTQLTNTNLTLDVSQTSVVTATNYVTVTWGLYVKQPMTGVNWKSYLKAVDTASNSTGWVNLGTWRVNMFPNTGGLTPAIGNVAIGTAQIFTTTYSDEDGVSNLKWAFIRATMQPSPFTEQLRAYYNPANNRMYLYNNGSWIGGLVVGTPGTIETTTAILDVGNSSVVLGAKVLTVNWSITFKAGTEGVKDIWGYVYDVHDFVDGWGLLGHWTIGSGALASLPQETPPDAEAPIPLDVPSDFQPIYRTPDLDPGLITSEMVSRRALSTGVSDPQMPSLESIATPRAKVMPKPLPGKAPSPTDMPTTGVFSPPQANRAPGWGWNFRAQFGDTSGYAHLSKVYLLFSMDGGTQNAIYVMYDQDTNRVYLRDSADANWIGGYAPGADVRISNKNGTLDVLKTTILTYGSYYLDLNAQLIFKALGQSQHYRVFLAASDDAGNASGWSEKSWFRVNLWAANGGVTPSANTQAVGATQSYTSTYTDPEGATDLKYVFFNVAATGGGKTQAMYAHYNRATNQIKLLDDAGTTWLGPIIPGVATDAQNSWVIIHGAGCSVNTSGDKLTVVWSIEFKPTMGGTTKNIYLYAQDKLDWIDSWKYAGQIQITP